MNAAAYAALESIVGPVVFEDARTDLTAGRVLRTAPGLAPDEKAEVLRRAYAILRHLRLVRHVAGVPGAATDPWPEGAFARIEAALAVVESRRPEFSPPGFSAEVASRRLADAKERFPATAFSLPDFLFEKLRPALGKKLEKVAAALLESPGCAFRVNTRKITPEALSARLSAAGHSIRAGETPGALFAEDRHALMRSAEFEEGFFEVQDAGSQRVAPFLEVAAGMRVVDACAGEGGKTLHLSNLMNGAGRIEALDVAPGKLASLRERAARADAQNISARPITGPETWSALAGTADRVLIDAPCSGTGVLRRQPEIKWRLTPESLAGRVALQAEILDAAAFAAKPGGLVVYATCSLLSEENESQVARFLARHPGVFLAEAQRRILPGIDGDTDGFFMARIRRLA